MRGVHAVAWSGGKDSALALDRAVRRGLDVRYALNLYHAASGRVRFHGVRRAAVERQMRRVGLVPLQLGVGEDDFEAVFLSGLATLASRGVAGVVFGNVHLADVRAWYEERTRGSGLAHVEPLWGEPARVLLGELLERGYRTRIVSVDLERGEEALLGRELDRPLADELLAATRGDPVGEHGEYHSFVFDGPLFSAPLALTARGRIEMPGHLLLDLDVR